MSELNDPRMTAREAGDAIRDMFAGFTPLNQALGVTLDEMHEMVRTSIEAQQRLIGLMLLPIITELFNEIMRPIRAYEAVKRAVMIAVALFVMLTMSGGAR